MKLKIERADLSDLLSRGGASAARGSTIPILGHVRLSARNGSLEASTTDLNLQAVASAAAEVDTPGETTVNANALSQFVSKLPASSGSVSIEWDALKSVLTIKAGRQRANIPTLPVDDFPSLEVAKGENPAKFVLSGADLSTLFGRTRIAVSTEETRYYLNGVMIHPATAHLKAVATNGHILLMTSVSLPDGAERMAGTSGRNGVIVPTGTVNAALKLFSSAETISISISARGITFESGTTRLVSKLIDGTFPDYGRVIPQVSPNLIRLDRASCISAVSTVEVFQQGDGGHAVECGEDPEGLAMATGGGDGGGEGFALAMADFEGSVPNFGVSSKYLKSALGAFIGEIITLSISDPASPIRFESDKDPGTIGVVMPMRVGTTRLGKGAVQ